MSHEEVRAVKHVIFCVVDHCPYPLCNEIKHIFMHAGECEVGEPECYTCRSMWNLLCLHSIICKDNLCLVPHCSVIKEQMTRMRPAPAA